MKVGGSWTGESTDNHYAHGNLTMVDSIFLEPFFIKTPHFYICSGQFARRLWVDIKRYASPVCKYTRTYFVIGMHDAGTRTKDTPMVISSEFEEVNQVRSVGDTLNVQRSWLVCIQVVHKIIVTSMAFPDNVHVQFVVKP